jgi:hypothetical protein
MECIVSAATWIIYPVTTILLPSVPAVNKSVGKTPSQLLMSSGGRRSFTIHLFLAPTLCRDPLTSYKFYICIVVMNRSNSISKRNLLMMRNRSGSQGTNEVNLALIGELGSGKSGLITFYLVVINTSPLFSHHFICWTEGSNKAERWAKWRERDFRVRNNKPHSMRCVAVYFLKIVESTHFYAY